MTITRERQPHPAERPSGRGRDPWCTDMIPARDYGQKGGKQRRKGEKQLDKPRRLGYAGQDYNRIAADSASHWEGKRESGENPERSGHCKRGTGRTMPLRFVRRRGRWRSVSQETC